jgi:glycosyltransferase involved in cell wall biosynthesis
VLPGRVGAAQIRVLMERSSAGLVPYEPRWDFVRNIPNKAIEYLSAGLPIITCLEGALEDLVTRNDCGSLYENGNALALADAVRSLFANEHARRRQHAAALALFEDVFDADRVYSDYVVHLEHIARSGAGS